MNTYSRLEAYRQQAHAYREILQIRLNFVIARDAANSLK